MDRPDGESSGRTAKWLLVVAAVLLVASIGIGFAVDWAAAAVPALIAIVVGSVAIGMRVGDERGATAGSIHASPSIDPFSVSEPWRQFVQRAQRSERDLERIIDTVAPGPLRDRLATILDRLDGGVQETWRIARRGDAIDDTVRQLDPVRLRSRLAQIQAQSTDSPGDAAAVEALERQLSSVERLQAQSTATVESLQLTQLRVEELVGRAAEVSIGGADTDAYANDVDELVVELEALRQAIDETDRL